MKIVSTAVRVSAVSFVSAVAWCAGGTAFAADLGPPPAAVPAAPPSAWSFRFVPYGWLTSLDGTQTVRGRSVEIDASFTDVVEQSDSLLALMGTVEARRGPLAFYADTVWTSIGFERENIKTRDVAPGVTARVGRALGLDIQMAIVEIGAAYEVARSGALALDVLGGARYWYQEADLSLEVAGTLGIGDLERVGARAFARSGSVDWIDPLFGARIRYAVAPGHELFLRGDIGGFGFGSDFSWQAIGGYGINFGTWNGVTVSGVLGYRALSVDYAQGEGRRRYEFDVIQHGPVLGLSLRF
jgi:hypothetical protein